MDLDPCFSLTLLCIKLTWKACLDKSAWILTQDILLIYWDPKTYLNWLSKKFWGSWPKWESFSRSAQYIVFQDLRCHPRFKMPSIISCIFQYFEKKNNVSYTIALIVRCILVLEKLNCAPLGIIVIPYHLFLPSFWHQLDSRRLKNQPLY